MTIIHVVESALGTSDALTALLDRQGYASRCFAAPHEFFYQLGKLPPRCAIIDWELSQACSLDVVKRTRQLLGGRVGIIMLTSSESEDQVLSALAAGADDCIVTPTTDEMLAARIEALLRRLVPRQVAMDKRIVRGPYTLDLGSRTATVDGRDGGLAPREFDLAWTLFSQLSRLFTKDELLALIWGKQTEFGAHTISQHVYALRKKLKFDDHGFKLQSVYATGYRLECIDTPSRPRALPSYVRAGVPVATAWR